VRLRFGDCVFDRESRTLESGDRVIPISPKAFHFLDLLLSQRPKALAKSDLHDALWPDTFVVETNLANLAAEVREAIGEKGRRDGFLRTVHGFGYAFRSEGVEEEGAQGARTKSVFSLVADGRHFPLAEGVNVLGRDPGADVFLDDDAVSRRHARVTVDGAKAVVEDLGSKNGTFLGGRKVEEPAPLAGGDALLVGSILLVVSVARGVGTTATLRQS
jgi:DNA-binding winged helix-turn-helix (wHTH) protein